MRTTQLIEERIKSRFTPLHYELVNESRQHLSGRQDPQAETHLDGRTAHLKDSLMPTYAELLYNGYWWAPERKALQQLIDSTQKNVTGRVRMQLYKGNVTVTGRQSPHSLFDARTATFEDSKGFYDHKDAAGFIRLNALRFLHQNKEKD